MQGEDKKTKQVAVLSCSTPGCDNICEKNVKNRANPKYYTDFYQRQGWEIDSRGHWAKCPSCIEAEAEAKTSKDTTPEQEESSTMEAATQSNVTPINTVASSSIPAEKKLSYSEKVLSASFYLEENFKPVDEILMVLSNNAAENMGYYINGASDELGAEESGLSLEIFIKIRESDFGQIFDMQGIDKLSRKFEAEFAEVSQQHAELQRERDRLVELSNQSSADTEALFKEFSDRGKRLIIDRREAMKRVTEQFERDAANLQTEFKTRIEAQVKKAQVELLEEMKPLDASLKNVEARLHEMTESFQLIKLVIPSDL